MGGAYSNSTGVFTCPVSGYYSFIVSVQTRENRNSVVRLQHNNIDVYQVFSYKTKKGYQSATNSAIIKLDKHDTVRVVAPGSGYYIYSHPTEITTTFSGQMVAVA